MTTRKIAKQQNIPFENTKYVIGHLDGSISIASVDDGKIVNVNNVFMGISTSYSNCAGALPGRGIMTLCTQYLEKI